LTIFTKENLALWIYGHGQILIDNNGDATLNQAKWSQIEVALPPPPPHIAILS
jgi:hypothetical protein